jgi:hypothetical protein
MVGVDVLDGLAGVDVNWAAPIGGIIEVSWVVIAKVTVEVAPGIIVFLRVGMAVENQSGAEPVEYAKTRNPAARSRGKINTKLMDFFMKKLYDALPAGRVGQKSLYPFVLPNI